MTTVYYTATSLDGFITDPEGGLGWLFTRDNDPRGAGGWETFRPGIGACVMGANTYQWILDNDPEAWDHSLPTWVMTHRTFPPREGVVFTADPAETVHQQMGAAAGGKDLWVVGGGDLAGQFAEVGLLDVVSVHLAPVTLGGGAPLLPRHVELVLEDVERNRDFAVLRYRVAR